MNRTLTNVFLHARNALPSRSIRPICRSCSITQHYPQWIEYHMLRPMPNLRPIIFTTSVRYASTKLANPPGKTRSANKPGAKKAVKVKKSSAKKQRMKKKAAKKKETKRMKRKAEAASKPSEKIERVEALSLVQNKKRPERPSRSQIRRDERKSKEKLEEHRIRKLQGKRNKARNDRGAIIHKPKTPISKRKLPSAEKIGLRTAPECTWVLRYSINGSASHEEKETFCRSTEDQEID